MPYIVNQSQQNWKFIERRQSQAKVARLNHLDLHRQHHLLLPLHQAEGLQILSQQIRNWCFLTQFKPSVLSTVVDVRAELYNLPSFQFLHQLLEYLYSQHGFVLRPVSTYLISLFYYCCVIIVRFWVGFYRSSVPE